jgi:aryl-alcohol dehydrogenase-like predicted oxidoreductase
MTQEGSGAQAGEMRTLGQTGIETSAVGLGTWAIGSGWGDQNEKDSVAAIHRALDLGCRFLDTAQVYGEGRSERLIAQVFKDRGQRVPVATKVPPKDYIWEKTAPGTPMREKFPAQYLIERCEQSLRNLATDCLDVYQLHMWSAEWNDETEWYETMLKLREQGKINAIGLSLLDTHPDSANGVIVAGRVDSVQLVYNIFDQRPRTQVFPLAAQHGVGILARVPLASGALSGRWTSQTRFPRGDWRADVFTGEELERTLGYVDAVRFLEEPGHSLAEMAIRFAFSDPAVSAAIPGARNPQQAEALMNAWHAGPLPEDTLTRLDELWRTTFSRHIQTSIQGTTES